MSPSRRASSPGTNRGVGHGTSGTNLFSAADQVPDKEVGTGTDQVAGTADKPLTRAVPDVPVVPDYARCETEADDEFDLETDYTQEQLDAWADEASIVGDQ